MIKKTLGQIANINGGQIVARIEKKTEEDLFSLQRIEDDVKKSIDVLMPKAISEGYIEPENLSKIVYHEYNSDLDGLEGKKGDDYTILDYVDESKLTSDGCLVLKLSTPFEACIIDKENEGLLIPSFCAKAIITDLGIDPNYLLAFLNSELYRSQVRDIVAESSIALVSVSALKDIEIPVPPIQMQKKIGNDFVKTMKKKKLLEKIVQLESEKLNSSFYELEA